MTSKATLSLPEELLKLTRRLRLPYLRAHAPEVIATAKAQRWDPAEVLRVLLDEEAKGRDTATREMRRRRAQFPSGKTFQSWREQDSSIPVATQRALMTLEWVSRTECLSISGPSGTGKSHFVEALGHRAIDSGLKVSWFTLETLTQTIGRSKVDASTAKVVARICRADLVVVDDIGMLPAGQAEAEALYRIADAAYETRSVAVTSNIHPASTRSCPRRSRHQPWTGCFTTPTSSSPKESRSVSLRPWVGRGWSLWLKLSRGGLVAVPGDFPWPRLGILNGRLRGDPDGRYHREREGPAETCHRRGTGVD